MAYYEDVSPARGAVAITLHDTNLLAKSPCRRVYVGGAGDLKVTMADGTTVTFTGVAAGTTLDIQAKVLWSTGSTATNVVALY